MSENARTASTGEISYATGSYKCPHCKKTHPGFISRCPDSGEHVDRAFKMGGRLLEDKYEVGERLAKGGMGVVYRGRHLKLDRKVAIKFLLGEFHKSPVVIQRFENEARLAASVGHRNIVDIMDVGQTDDGIHYMVMEYLDGRDLGEILDEAVRLTPHVAVDLTIQILSALRAVHEQGIIHRDLKPENVFIGVQPGGGLEVKILDFGISRLGADDPANLHLTRTGAVFGTPGYMAPEQARGSRHVDRRTDLYAVGVMLYEMLSGALPFDAENYNSMIIAITTEEPMHVSRHGVPLPGDLEDVVMRAISREPGDRFANASEFFEALRPFRSASAFEARVEPGPQPMLDWSDAASVGVPSGRPALPSSDSAIVRPSSLEHARHRAKAPTPDSVAGQDIIITLDTSVRPGETPHPDPAASGWQEHGPGQPVREQSISSIPPDTSISLNGWVGPASIPPPRPRRWPVPGWLVVASAAVLLLVVSGALTFAVIKARGLEQRVSAADAGPVKSPSFEIEPSPEPRAWTVEIEGLPEGAEVYVDSTLHPERPLVLDDAAEPRLVRIVAQGYEPWEKKVAVRSDTTLSPDLIESTVSGQKGDKKGKRKKAPARDKPRIDKDYPGLM